MKYKNIIDLRNIPCDRDRGYKFEQEIRKILPRDFKPPVPVQDKEHSEQLDGILLWKNQAYLIESKAKKGKITAGSHDWEDFELKITRRRNTVIGIFCSLYPIHTNACKRANELVNQGNLIILLEGSFWDELSNSSLDIADVLDYMNIYGRSKLIAKPPHLNTIEQWRFDKDEIINRISNLCTDYSSLFLGRHKSDSHDHVYIVRDVEKDIESYIKKLNPNILTRVKESPKQICLLRDFSGSGKTTISIQVSSMNDTYFGVGMTANEQSIDQKCFTFFKSLGDDYGIRELTKINRPIIYVIDSLDEAYSIAGKNNEIKAILRKIKKLNEKAEEYDMPAYPILFVFTLREDYWRDWESIFEGSNRFDINKRISCFTETELREALKKYMNYYGYEIVNELTEETLEVLSRPINLLIFSETYQKKGQIEVHEIWESEIIYNYFERKLDDISKRNIPNYDPQAYMDLLSDLAYVVICSKKTVLGYNQIVDVIKKNYRIYYPFCEKIVKVLISEHILVCNSDDNYCYRFRHSRFLEFLMACYCIHTLKNNYSNSPKIVRNTITHKTLSMIKKTFTRQINNKKSDKKIYYIFDELIEKSFSSGLVAIFRIHEDMRYICSKKDTKLLAELDDYYSTSNLFMSRKLSSLRSNLASNIKIQSNDISLILKNANSKNPLLTIETFFVIASKPCKQSNQKIIDTFAIAFKSKYNIPEQYKMILKLASNDLLCYEQVLACILQSDYPKNWETYLGSIIEKKQEDYDEFKELWKQRNGEKKLEQLMKQSELEDWTHVKKLLNIILSGGEYISGEI